MLPPSPVLFSPRLFSGPSHLPFRFQHRFLHLEADFAFLHLEAEIGFLEKLTPRATWFPMF